MADGVVRSPSRLCSGDGKICCYGDALSTIFLLAFVPCLLLFVFLFFLFYFFPASRYVYLLRVPSSVEQPSATLSKYVFYSTCSFCLAIVFDLTSEFCCFYSFSIFSLCLFLGWRFLGCVLVPGTLLIALDLPTHTLILQRRLVFLCLTYHIICIPLG